MRVLYKTIKHFFRKVKRVIDFLPIIWKGHDFDYQYAVELFKYQLERMADFFESDDAYGLDSKIQAQRIRTVLRLMDKVYKDEYQLQHIDLIQKHYGEEKVEFVDNKLIITHAYAVNEKHQKEILEIRKMMAKHGYEKHKRAHKLLWDMIEHRIQWWWD